MGRRRQHSGGLALASDEIPGLAQHNIYLGLVTSVSTCQAYHKSAHAHATLDSQKKARLPLPHYLDATSRHPPEPIGLPCPLR